jgi:hypothetical protein
MGPNPPLATRVLANVFTDFFADFFPGSKLALFPGLVERRFGIGGRMSCSASRTARQGHLQILDVAEIRSPSA